MLSKTRAVISEDTTDANAAVWIQLSVGAQLGSVTEIPTVSSYYVHHIIM